MTNTEITGCSDCPFCPNWDEFKGTPCRIQVLKAESPPIPFDEDFDVGGILRGETPDWCPLRQGPVTILLKSATCSECGVNGYQDGEKLHGALHGSPLRSCSKLWRPSLHKDVRNINEFAKDLLLLPRGKS